MDVDHHLAKLEPRLEQPRLRYSPFLAPSQIFFFHSIIDRFESNFANKFCTLFYLFNVDFDCISLQQK